MTSCPCPYSSTPDLLGAFSDTVDTPAGGDDIDPGTLKVSNKGVIMTPSHIHKAIQEYLDIDGFARDASFGLVNTESLPLFDPFLSTLT